MRGMTYAGEVNVEVSHVAAEELVVLAHCNTLQQHASKEPAQSSINEEKGNRCGVPAWVRATDR